MVFKWLGFDSTREYRYFYGFVKRFFLKSPIGIPSGLEGLGSMRGGGSRDGSDRCRRNMNGCEVLMEARTPVPYSLSGCDQKHNNPYKEHRSNDPYDRVTRKAMRKACPAEEFFHAILVLAGGAERVSDDGYHRNILGVRYRLGLGRDLASGLGWMHRYDKKGLVMVSGTATYRVYTIELLDEDEGGEGMREGPCTE